MFNLDNIYILLMNTRYPENVGMVARACANMGCSHLYLVEPERWDPFKAYPLATSCGRALIENIRIFDKLETAVAKLHLLFGTSARTGAFRKAALEPAALHNSGALFQPSLRTGFLFGPEDRGLSNEQLAICTQIVHIPTAACATSLNLAQAVLLILYELARSPRQALKEPQKSRRLTIGQLNLLEQKLQKILLFTQVLPASNPEHFFQHWHHLLVKCALSRREYDALMGFCRQLEIFIPGLHKSRD